jgi:hypothetical protein
MLSHFVLITTLHVARQSQPAFRHVQENKLVVRVSDCLSQLGASLGMRSVRSANVHERPKSFNFAIVRHLTAAPHRLFPNL